MSDSEKVGLIPYENSGKRGILRFASVAVLLLATGMALLLCWRRHFSREALLDAGLAIAVSLYLAYFFYRRSRGLSARLFYSSVDPADDEGLQDQVDMGALAGLVVAIGVVAYRIIKHW
jgi:hypothetical protein